MQPGEVVRGASTTPIYEKVPLKAEEIVIVKQGNGNDRRGSTMQGGGQGKGEVSRYKESLEELQKVIKVLESERFQMTQSLVDQHAKIDYSMQVILDEIAALKAQAAQENDLNVLMVQFIVMAVRLLVEAAFSKDKVDELLPALEAELQRLQLPARHPRLLACFNRLREVCGKPPVSQRDVASTAVVISAASSGEGLPNKSLSATKSILSMEQIMGHGSSSGEALAARSGSGRSPGADALVTSGSGEGLPTKSGSGAKLSGSQGSYVGLATGTSLVDESDDEKRQPPLSISEAFPSLVVNDEPVVGSSSHHQLSKSSSSAEFPSKRDVIFTTKERRRTATAIGDGDLPLFQQFAVAGAAPAPDEFSGLRKPMDTASLSKVSKPGPPHGNVPAIDVSGEVQAPPLASSPSGVNSSTSLSETGFLSAEGSVSGQGDAFEYWGRQGQPSKSRSGLQQPVQYSSSRLQNASATLVPTPGSPPTVVADMNQQGSSTSFEGLLKHATTILSMSPSELRAALLQSASGAKFSSGLKPVTQQSQQRGEIVGPTQRLDSEGPPAPMPSAVDFTSKDQVQLIQEAMATIASVAMRELKEKEKQNDGVGREALGASSLSPSLIQTDQERSNAGMAPEVPPPVQLPAAQKEVRNSRALDAATLDKTLLTGTIIQNGRSVDHSLSPPPGSPFAGRIAPPSTPDALAHPKGEYADHAVPPSEPVPHNPGLYIPAEQVAWQQFFNNAAASERQRNGKAFLEGQEVMQGQWPGVPFALYQNPHETATGSVHETQLDADSATGHGFVYVNPSGNYQSPVGPGQAGLVDFYGASVPAIPSVRIVRPVGRRVAPERAGIDVPHVLVPSTQAWSSKPHEPRPHNTAVVSQQSSFETPRVEGGWACCRRMTREQNRSERKAPNH